MKRRSLNAYRVKLADFERDITGWYDTIVNTDHDDIVSKILELSLTFA